MSLAQTFPLINDETSVPPAESSTLGALEGRVDFLLRGEGRSSTALLECKAPNRLTETGTTLRSLRSGHFYINDILLESPDRELILSSLYTPNVAATIATLDAQALWMTPDKMWLVDLNYPMGSIVAVPMLRGVTSLERLLSAYVVSDPAKILSFVQQNRLTDILVQALAPIGKAFGERLTRKLTLVEDDEGSRTLFCFVAFPGTLDEAQKALDSFDRNWWLMHAKEFGSKLNFDFELA